MTTTQQITLASLETAEASHSQYWHLPVTVADLARHKIESEGGFGIDADEAADLADEPGLVRLVLGVTCDDDATACRRVIDTQVFQQSRPGAEPRWESLSPRYHHVAGYATRLLISQNAARMWALAKERISDLHAALDAALDIYNAACYPEDATY